METMVKPGQTRGRKGRWPSEQKLAILQEWKNGVPLEEVCRKYGVNAAQMYRWKHSLDQGLHPRWKTKFARRSPAYTTSWDDLVQARAS